MNTQTYATSSLLKAALLTPLLLSVLFFLFLLVIDNHRTPEDWYFLSIIMMMFSGATYLMSLLFVFPLLCLLRRFVTVHFLHILLLTCVAGMVICFTCEYVRFVNREQYYLIVIMVGTAFGLVAGGMFYAILRLCSNKR